jgi:cobalt-zinc-cadmium efflux system outer membrane protein
MSATMSAAPVGAGLAALVLIAMAIGAKSAPLGLPETLALAQAQAPSLAARRHDLAAAKSVSVAAGRLPDPKLRVGLDSFPISGPAAGRFGPEPMTQASVGLMQEMPSGERRRADRQRAAADISLADAKARAEARAVRIAAAAAWTEVTFAHRRLEALDALAKTFVLMRATAPAQLAGGTASPAQALEPQRLTAQLADRRASLAAGLIKARAELARWTGDEESDSSGAPPKVVIDAVALRANLDQLPAFQLASAARRQADADYAAAKASTHPDWGWELGYGKRDARWGDLVTVTATTSLPLFQATRQAPVIAARSEAVAAARADQQAMHRELRAALDADLADLDALNGKVERARTVFVPLAERQAELERARYAAATAGLADVLQAQAALAEARLDLLDREADAERAALRISLTYGDSDQ